MILHKSINFVLIFVFRITTRSEGSSGTIYPPLLSVTYSEAVPEDYMRNKKVTVKSKSFLKYG